MLCTNSNVHEIYLSLCFKIKIVICLCHSVSVGNILASNSKVQGLNPGLT